MKKGICLAVLMACSAHAMQVPPPKPAGPPPTVSPTPPVFQIPEAVSYTHLTLPTNREV